jgi:hypothetical protein
MLDGRTPLHLLVIQRASIHEITALLERPEGQKYLHTVDEVHGTPLAYATLPSVIRVLIQHGADIRHPHRYLTPFQGKGKQDFIHLIYSLLALATARTCSHRVTTAFETNITHLPMELLQSLKWILIYHSGR